MHPEVFRKRMAYLKQNKYPVLALSQALEMLRQGSLPDRATVITFDDGWHNVYRYCHSILLKNGFPYTIYLASYYALKETPVFNLIVQYLFWKTSKPLNSSDLFKALDINLSVDQESDTCEKIIEYGEKQLSHPERNSLIGRLSEILDIDYKKILESSTFHLINRAQAVELENQGSDFQLHTHRHQWPEAESAAIKEVNDNREFLASIVDHPLVHFCYPSGFFTIDQFKFLDQTGIKSATTCEPGFNSAHSHPLALSRFLDGQYISQIEFEAEMSGFLELFRWAKSAFARARMLSTV